MTVVPPQLRTLVVQRAHQRCEYCLLPQALQVATFPVDHIAPRSRGGLTESNNLALACPRCNALKWTHVDSVDTGSQQVVELFHPRRHVWTEHFRWSPEDMSVLEPLTPVGRATANLLDLNSSDRVAIRRWLTVIGQHPPADVP